MRIRRLTSAALSIALSLTAAALTAAAVKPPPKQAPPASHPPSALQLYKQSLAVQQRYAYQGRQFLTVWRDDDTAIATATDITHAPPDQDCIVYTAPRSRGGRVIIQVGRDQWTYIPQDGIVVHSTEGAPEPATTQYALFQLLLHNYSLKVLPHPIMIAGRKAFGVTLMPYAPGRPYDHIWVDPYTGLVLRREKYHADNSLASVSYFSDIHFSVRPSPQDFNPQRWATLKPRVVDQPAPPESNVDPSHLPPPFAGQATVPKDLDGYVIQKATLLSNGKKPSLHLLYSDGLNTLSLFETLRATREPTHVPASRLVMLGIGQVAKVSQRYSYSILSWDVGGLNYTLIGDSSEKLLVELAQATGATGFQAAPKPAAKSSVRRR
jgi:hypothetical protein